MNFSMDAFRVVIWHMGAKLDKPGNLCHRRQCMLEGSCKLKKRVMLISNINITSKTLLYSCFDYRSNMPASRSQSTSSTKALSTALSVSPKNRASSRSGEGTWPMSSDTSPLRPSTLLSRTSTRRFSSTA